MREEVNAAGRQLLLHVGHTVTYKSRRGEFTGEIRSIEGTQVRMQYVDSTNAIKTEWTDLQNITAGKIERVTADSLSIGQDIAYCSRGIREDAGKIRTIQGDEVRVEAVDSTGTTKTEWVPIANIKLEQETRDAPDQAEQAKLRAKRARERAERAEALRV